MAFNTPLVDNEIPSAAKWNTAVAVYDSSTAEVDVVNTIVQTVVYQKTIAAGHLSTNRMLRLTLLADYLNNSGAVRNLTIETQLQGVTIGLQSYTGIAAGATRLAASMELWLMNLGSASVQATVIRTPNFSNNGVAEMLLQTDAINTAIAGDLRVIVSHSVADANLSYRKKGAVLELL